MTEKPVLLEIDNVRIIRFNEMNLVVERYEDVFIPTKKRKEKRWVFHGYINTILDALKFINSNELLIDETSITDLNDYVKQVQESNDRLLEAVIE